MLVTFNGKIVCKLCLDKGFVAERKLLVPNRFRTIYDRYLETYPPVIVRKCACKIIFPEYEV
jgi:hypothetical protein